MATNFYNSAGTDLDSLFYSDNSNGGAIGFLTPNGVDLGNKFTNKATLGYNLGYKNSAGTDIGYLRGKAVAPNLILDLTLDKHVKNSANTKVSGCGSEGDESYTCTTYSYDHVYKLVITDANNQPMSNVSIVVQLYFRQNPSGAYTIALNNDKSTFPTLIPESCECGSTYPDKAGYSGATYKNSTSASQWTNCFTCTKSPNASSVVYYFTSSMNSASFFTGGTQHGTADIRVQVTATNAAGSTTSYSKNIYFKVNRGATPYTHTIS